MTSHHLEFLQHLSGDLDQNHIVLPSLRSIFDVDVAVSTSRVEEPGHRRTRFSRRRNGGTRGWLFDTPSRLARRVTTITPASQPTVVKKVVSTDLMKSTTPIPDLPLELWERIVWFMLAASNPCSILPLRLISRSMKAAVDDLFQQQTRILLSVQVSSLWEASRPPSGKYFSALPVQLQMNSRYELDWTFLVRFFSPTTLMLKHLYDPELTLENVSGSLNRLMQSFQPAIRELALTSVGPVNMTHLNGLHHLTELFLSHDHTSFIQPSWTPKIDRLCLQSSVIDVHESIINLTHVHALCLKSVIFCCSDESSRDVLVHAPELLEFSWTSRRLRTRFPLLVNVELIAPKLKQLKLSYMDHTDNAFVMPQAPSALTSLTISACNGVRFPWRLALQSGAKDLYALNKISTRDELPPLGVSSSRSLLNTQESIRRVYLCAVCPRSFLVPIPWDMLALTPSLNALHLCGHTLTLPSATIHLPCLQQVWIHLNLRPWLPDSPVVDSSVDQQQIWVYLFDFVVAIQTLFSRPQIFLLTSTGTEVAVPSTVTSLVHLISWADIHTVQDSDFLRRLPEETAAAFVDFNTLLTSSTED